MFIYLYIYIFTVYTHYYIKHDVIRARQLPTSFQIFPAILSTDDQLGEQWLETPQFPG
jgi:hypothetical protein